MNRPRPRHSALLLGLVLIVGLAHPALAEDDFFNTAVEIRPTDSERPTSLRLRLPSRLENGKTTPVQIATPKGSGLGTVALADCARPDGPQTVLAADLFDWRRLGPAAARRDGRNWLAVFEQPRRSPCRMTLAVPMSIPGIEGSDIGSGG